MNHTAIKPWAIGPFTRLVDHPVIKPMPELVFDCPMHKRPVHWAENHTFNPAAVVRDDKIHLLYRAEDGQGDVLATYTSRIGLASSKDGVNFDFHPEPVLYPDDDEWIGDEWYGGCEDPRIVEAPDGTYFLYYNMHNRGNPKGFPRLARIGVASSTDLINWTKHGPAFPRDLLGYGHKAVGVVQEIKDGRLIAARIQGRYWMYWGEDGVRLAHSTDLIHWEPVRDAGGEIAMLIPPRPGFFDSFLAEVGPPAVRIDDGIILIYNGRNCSTQGDTAIALDTYCPAQALFDRDDPSKLLDRSDKPFMQPELDFERTGQYAQGTVFTEGLVLFKDKWHLYYGTADTFVGVATAPV